MVSRLLNHLTTTRWHLRRAFPADVLDQIEAAISTGEHTHAGELRMAIEASLDSDDVFSNVSPRERALQVFNGLAVWDTADNNGVLIYVLYAEHAIEIVADRGYNQRINADIWREICAVAEVEFRAGRFANGAVALVSRISELISRHFPRQTNDFNELPNRPILL